MLNCSTISNDKLILNNGRFQSKTKNECFSVDYMKYYHKMYTNYYK